MHKDVLEILISREQIEKRVKELAAQIDEDYAGKELIVVSILTGAMPFTTELFLNLQGDARLDSIKASSYGNSTSSSGTVEIIHEIRSTIAGKHVLLVDDVVDSGRTLKALVERLKERQPASIKTCVFLDKKECRAVDFDADYVGYDIPDAFVIGYGLDYAEKYRNLPYVGIIKPEAVRND